MGDETGLKSRWSQVAVFVPQFFCELKGLHKDGFAVRPRAGFFEDSIKDLPGGFEGVNEFRIQHSNRKHAGFIRLVAMVARPEVYQNGLMGFHDLEACSDREGRRKPQTTHKRIRLANH